MLLKNKVSIKVKANERPNASDAWWVQTPAYNDVKKALYTWFVTVRASNIFVSGPILQWKAMEFAYIFGQDNLCAGLGWLQRFKDRYSILGKFVTGESCAVDVDNAKKWVQENWLTLRPTTVLVASLMRARLDWFGKCEHLSLNETLRDSRNLFRFKMLHLKGVSQFERIEYGESRHLKIKLIYAVREQVCLKKDTIEVCFLFENLSFVIEFFMACRLAT